MDSYEDMDIYADEDRYESDRDEWEAEQVWQDGQAERLADEMSDDEIENEIAAAERRDEDAMWRAGCGV